MRKRRGVEGGEREGEELREQQKGWVEGGRGMDKGEESSTDLEVCQ